MQGLTVSGCIVAGFGFDFKPDIMQEAGKWID